MEYKYYFKKPRGEIVKDILLWLAFGGAVTIVAASSPNFLYNALLAFQKSKKYKKQSVRNAFQRLRHEGVIAMQKHNHQLYLSLTAEGRKRAGRFQIDSLSIKKPKKWDGKWRIVMFDIPNRERMKREAFRGFLRRLSFYRFQKSVWIHPFDCSDEISLLRNFFGFTPKELQLVVAEKVEHDSALRKAFHI